MGLADPASEPVEMIRIGWRRARRDGPLQKQAAQPLTVLIPSYRFAYVLR